MKINALLLVGCNAAIGGFLFGYDTGSMSGALLQIKRPRHQAQCPGLSDDRLTIVEQSLVMSFTVLGAFFSASVAGQLTSTYGRRPVLLAGSQFLIVGSLLMAGATSLPFMLIARIVVGLGVGIASHTVPLYISECSPAHMRGSMCFLNDMMIVTGQISATAVSTGLFYGEVKNGWRLILGLAAIPAAAMFAGISLSPESPRWLLSQERVEDAKSALMTLREGTDPIAVESELRLMTHGVNRELMTARSLSPIPLYWKDVRVRRALMLGCGLQALQQLCGINTVMYYGAAVMRWTSNDSRSDSCFTDQNKEDVAQTVLFAGAQLIGVLCSWFLVEEVGRRPLLLTSGTAVTLALVAIGGAFSTTTISTTAVVICVGFYLISFGAGMSPVPWTVNAEIYPQHVRSQCISISTCTNWLVNFFVAASFLPLARELQTNSSHQQEHPGGVFWLYAVISALGMTALYLWMPETKGLTLEQIGDLFYIDKEEKAESARTLGWESDKL
eukprot:gnl/TRDRNA2_/TRDRNA2_180839_c0_seq1.p1 gnl/TRDRNA2_/TRDRNA2_180839_c0~~gnl/TRDRNA2_/TRDRNA2_180839_c0_seq1.p1  ORF type:complete len:501 (+),score=59.69 gnl/TRDRNA2_/TRDRNA2_180839_c0_seq1:102-1604(+)